MIPAIPMRFLCDSYVIPKRCPAAPLSRCPDFFDSYTSYVIPKPYPDASLPRCPDFFDSYDSYAIPMRFL